MRREARRNLISIIGMVFCDKGREKMRCGNAHVMPATLEENRYLIKRMFAAQRIHMLSISGMGSIQRVRVLDCGDGVCGVTALTGPALLPQPV